MALNGNYPVTIEDAGGAGNCFYYSIWAALTESDLIRRNILPKMMDIPLDKERFMLYLRNVVADTLKKSNQIEGIYDYYSDIGVKNILPAGIDNLDAFLHPGNSVSKDTIKRLRPKIQEAYDLLNLNEIQEWMADIFISSKSVAEFKRRVIEAVRTQGNNVQEFEVRTIIDLFKERFNIEIRTHYNRNASGRALDMPLNLPMINESGKEIIHVLVLIGGEGHYRYFSFLPEPIFRRGKLNDKFKFLSLQQKPVVYPSLEKAPSENIEWGEFVSSPPLPQKYPLKKASTASNIYPSLAELENFGHPPSNIYPSLDELEALSRSGGKRKRKTVRRHRSIKNKTKNKRKPKKGGKKGKKYTYKK